MKKDKYFDELKNQVRFIQGDEAAAYGAIYAGCDFFAGYPITPASEVAELMAKELPKVDGYYIQMEDEIASMGAVIGAVWAGWSCRIRSAATPAPATRCWSCDPRAAASTRFGVISSTFFIR